MKVRFVRNYVGRKQGQEVELDDHSAKRLIARGVADEVKPAGTSKTKKPSSKSTDDS